MRVRLPAARCARQPLYCWRLDTPTKGAEHETSTGDEQVGNGGAGRVLKYYHPEAAQVIHDFSDIQ
ncbi:MAG: hypothetical protein CMJ70_12605 [Planctomycetaceae bacterium]|nr:hypothetical protein [Planctomycetaceae bacterium]HAA72376.1 hypothetical protein [Planctomycetaceae bacterium]